MSHLFILIHIPGLIFVTVCSVYVDKYIKLNITFNHSILSLSNEHLNWRPAVELTKRNFTVLYEYLKNHMPASEKLPSALASHLDR